MGRTGRMVGVMMEDEKGRHWFFDPSCLGLARELRRFLRDV
jgi:hypothetical protein